MTRRIYTQSVKHKILNPWRMKPNDPLNIPDIESEESAYRAAKEEYDLAKSENHLDIKKMIEAREKMRAITERMTKHFQRNLPRNR